MHDLDRDTGNDRGPALADFDRAGRAVSARLKQDLGIGNRQQRRLIFSRFEVFVGGGAPADLGAETGFL